MNALLQKIALVASVSLALALTFSCSSDSSGPDGGNPVGNLVSSGEEINSSSSSSAPQVNPSVPSSSSVLSSSSSEEGEEISSSSSEEPSSSSIAESSSSNTTPFVCNAQRGEQKNIGPNVSTQKFNLTLPSTGNGPFPVILHAFGGAFVGGSPTVGAPFNNGPSKGYATVALNYRLASNGNKSFPGLVEDVLAEIRYLKAHANELCLDTNKFVMTGFSAGAYLTALVASISGSSNPAHPFNETASDAGVSSQVQVAVSCAALSDFTKLNDQQKAIGGNDWMLADHYVDGQSLNLFFGEKVIVPPPSGSTIEKLLKDSNPFTYITQANCAKMPPIMMVHGTYDRVVPWTQSEIMVNKIKEVCGESKVQFVTHNGGHSDCPNGDQVFSFIDSKLGIQR